MSSGHIKDIVIAVLVTGIVAFMVGVKFEAGRAKDMAEAVSEATQVVETVVEEPVVEENL